MVRSSTDCWSRTSSWCLAASCADSEKILPAVCGDGEGKRERRGGRPMGNEGDEHFARVELPNALRAIYVRASTNRTLARKLVFDCLGYVGPDATKKTSRAAILKALALTS